MKFTGSNVLITGASKGIGADIARILAGYGLKVWINYRSNPTLADTLKEEINSSGAEASIISFDASSEDEFIAAIKAIIDSDGSLSYLVNNAGITNDKLALRMTVEDFDSVIKTNLNSAFIGCREAMKVMRKKKFGSVVNISSIVSESGNAGQVNYSASKGAMNSMTKSFALEAASSGIRYNAITPGFISTAMTDELSDTIKKSYVDKIPMKRFGNPNDVAEAVAFLLSDGSKYITGEVLKVNGGLYM
jgi:3-oxoacyl-[acyl-carrier protein] reductase